MSGSPPSADAPAPSAPTAGRLPPSVAESIEAHLRSRERRREELYERSRQLRRLAQSTIRLLVDRRPATGELAEVRARTAELVGWLRDSGRGDDGLAHDALQESVEATLLGAVVRGEPLPGPEPLGVEPEVYLLGLGDLSGEVRRLLLGRLTAGDLPAADALLAVMEDLYRTLQRFDTTRAIVSLKPKQDTARALLERTRGDVTLAHLLARVRPGGPGGGAP